MAITPALVTSITDIMSAMMIAAQGSGNNGLGDATLPSSSQYGAAKGINDIFNQVIQSADFSTIISMANILYNLLPSSSSSGSSTSFQGICYQSWVLQNLAQINTALISAISAAKISSVNSIDSYATYYNTGQGGNWLCLLNPYYQTLATILGQSFTPLNYYAPPIGSTTQFAGNNNLASFVVGGSFTPGQSVQTSKYAGILNPQVIATGLTGSGNVSITGINQAGTTGRTWTASNVSVNNTAYNLVPAVSTDLLVQVTSISVSSGITAGTIYVIGPPPSGRLYPPGL